jgi:7-keto-8-aminopelargonate synthetase-like enzyme
MVLPTAQGIVHDAASMSEDMLGGEEQVTLGNLGHAMASSDGYVALDRVCDDLHKKDR